MLRLEALLWKTSTLPSLLEPMLPGNRFGLLDWLESPPEESALAVTRVEPVAELTNVRVVALSLSTDPDRILRHGLRRG